jgi:transposase
MEVFHSRCAGLDVHKELIAVCVLIGLGKRAEKFKEKFGTFPDELKRLRGWLAELGVTHVLMESTGVYWMPIYDALEGALEIVVGNAQHVMNVPGRKTDESDAEWLAKLLRFGLVKPSFVPPRPFRELRQLTRHRRALVQQRSSEINRIEKHLQIAGIKLSSVASKVFTLSGTKMMREIANGNTDPQALSELALSHLRKKKAQLTRAFSLPISEHTQQLLGMQLRHCDRLDAAVAESEHNIGQRIHGLADFIAQLDHIPGIDTRTAIDILAETGTDMSPWKTHRHIAAMAGVCPANYISAGKRLKNRSRHGNPHLKSILVQAACSAINVNGSYYQAKFRRLKQRRGHKRAVVAIAHSILITIYYMLKRGEPYRELGARFVSVHDIQRRRNSLVKQLEQLGFAVTVNQVTLST